MNKSDREAQHQQTEKFFHCMSILTALLGIVAIIIGCVGWSSTNLVNIEKLVKFDMGADGGFVLTVHRSCAVLIWLGLIVIIGAVCGIIGSSTKNKACTCSFLGLSVTMGFCMLFLGVHAWGRQTIVESVIERQVKDICQLDTYVRLTQNLRCPGALAVGATPANCSSFCKERVGMLQNLDACKFLPRVCRNHTYVGASTMENPRIVTSNGAVADETACNEVCDKDIACKAYAFDAGATGGVSGKCWIKTGRVVTADNPNGIVTGRYANDFRLDLVNTPTAATQAKSDPLVLASFRKHGTRLAVIILVLAVCLIITAFVAWKVLYNHNINNDRRPTSGHICQMLFCCGPDQEEYKKPFDQEDPEEMQGLTSD